MQVSISPRFAAEQGRLHLANTGHVNSVVHQLCAGEKPDGSMKIRAIDDFTRSGINSITWPAEKLHYEAIDALVGTLRHTKHLVGPKIKLWKADIKSAYRLVPVAPESSDESWITFKARGKLVALRHYAMPFGSVASVHNWDRIGEFFLAPCKRGT